jgi:Bacterial capsule synthesis protein PGA_cap
MGSTGVLDQRRNSSQRHQARAEPRPARAGLHTSQPPRDVSRRVRRNRSIAVLLLLVIGAGGLWLAFAGAGGSRHGLTSVHRPHARIPAEKRLDPDWVGDGKPVTFAFGGDVNFPAGSALGERLAADPSSALGPGVEALLSGADLSMVNFESAVTTGPCPTPQPKSYVFYAPGAALTAFHSAGITLVTEANNHGEDCGEAGLEMALQERERAGYTILGIGQNAAEAFASFQRVINGQHIGIIAATQVIDSDLQTAWTATATQPGLASAYDVSDLVAAVQAARLVDDTVIVFLHWGVELDPCPDPDQEPLANILVKAGADVVVGSHAHVPLGGGYLGSAYVDYGLGNFAFYNTPPPTNQSGSLVITATGRRIDSAAWRPAVIEDELPVPLSNGAAASALRAWAGARSCTDLSSTIERSRAAEASESEPVPASIAQPLTLDH